MPPAFAGEAGRQKVSKMRIAMRIRVSMFFSPFSFLKNAVLVAVTKPLLLAVNRGFAVWTTDRIWMNNYLITVQGVRLFWFIRKSEP
jgi:hypothetical protein